MDVDGTGDPVVGVVDKEFVAVEELTGGFSPQFGKAIYIRMYSIQMKYRWLQSPELA